VYKLIKAPDSRGGQWEWYLVRPDQRRTNPEARPDVPADHIFIWSHPSQAIALSHGRRMGWMR
jgi:hypothetical protein